MSQLFPVSAKGVLIEDKAVMLLSNDRDEWELPGGRLESGETPEQSVVRECMEELGAAVQVGPILAAWVYEVLPEQRVFIVAYAIQRAEVGSLTISAEHQQMRWWPLDALPGGELPDGYRRAIGFARHDGNSM